MQVAVRYFASLAERTGCRNESVDVGEDDRVAQLWERLVARHPSLAEIGFVPLVVCDSSRVAWDRPLAGVREVAFLPPFSGG